MMPTISVKMVNADRLGDYEIWLFSASVAVSAAVGFVVAYAQGSPTPSGETQHEAVFAAAAIVCFVLFIAFFGRAVWIRRRLGNEARTYPMRAQQLSGQQRDADAE
jgi:cell division protein FtsW (lipid II flippase)